MAVNPIGYTESLLNWGRTGSFYPALVPDAQSQAELAAVRSKIVAAHPGSEPVDRLHSTLFFCKPSRLLEHMRSHVNPDIRPEMLYMDLSTIFGTIALTLHDNELPVDGLERFGDDGSIAALRLGGNGSFEQWRADIKELVVQAIRRNGAQESDLAIMREMPEYRWLLGASESHISLAAKIGQSDLPSLELPGIVRFDALADGSVTPPAGDPLRWYIMPMPE